MSRPACTPAAAAARKAAASSSSPRPMVDSRTGPARSASSSPSQSTSTSRCRPGGRAEHGRLLAHPLAELAVQQRHHDVGRRERHPAVGGQAVVRDAEVPLPGVRLRHPQARHRTPAQHRRGVDRLAGGHAGEAPAGARCPRLPGPWATTATSAPITSRAASSPVCTVTASRSPPKAWPTRHAAGDPARRAQLVHGAGEPRGQRTAVGHHVGHPRLGRHRAQPGDDGRQRRVQVGDHHRHPGQVVRVAQHARGAATPARPRRAPSPAAGCTGP